MNANKLFAVMAVGASCVASYADHLRPGTEVLLTFQDHVNSKTAKPGDHIRFVVKRDVDRGHHVVLAAGTRVIGVITTVDHRDHFGKNAHIRITIEPVNGIELQPRDKGQPIGGSRSTEAAATSVGAAVVLGPIGLVGGYFFTGHSVDIKPGATLRTEVSAGS